MKVMRARAASPKLLPHLHPKLLVKRGQRSSSSNTRGSVIAARASATRCCCPPTDWLAGVRQLGQAHLFLIDRRLVALGLRLPAHSQRNAMLSRTVNAGTGIGLEHHRGAPLDRRHGDVLAADHDPPAVGSSCPAIIRRIVVCRNRMARRKQQ